MKGFLIDFEGLDGAGKSTQVDLLKSYLKGVCGYPVYTTKWNSAPKISDLTQELKDNKDLDPNSFCLINALDYVYRYANDIKGRKKDGFIILADRDKYTGVARDTARGLDQDTVEAIYDLVPDPDIVFYLQLPVEEAWKRITTERQESSYYESGEDVTGKKGKASFLEYQGNVMDVYDQLAENNGSFNVIDATMSMEDIQKEIRDIVEDYMKNTSDRLVASS